MTTAAYPFLDIDDDTLTDEQLRQKYRPVAIGPTWQQNEDGSWLLPERTLGWQVAAWCAEWLGGPNGEAQWKFTLEQLRFVLWWYAVDEQGTFVYRTGVMQRLKGHGKDPLAAALCMVELLGPSQFGGWNKDGSPIGVPHKSAWVQLAAVNLEQTQNTTSVFPQIITERMVKEFKMTVGKEIIYGRGGKVRLKAVTSNPKGLEGGRTTFTLLNETHHWVDGNNGTRMYETIDGNATKVKGRYLAITNAYLPGENSVAEKMRTAYEEQQRGKAVKTRFLYDSLEAAAHTPMTTRVLPVVLDMIRGDSVWLDIDEIMDSILQSSIGLERSRRMWLNQIVADSEGLYSPAMWAACEVEGDLSPGDEIVLGFDGGKSDDATALVAMRVSDALVVPLGVWEKPSGPLGEGWEVDRAEVDSAVHDAFRLFEVVAFYADVELWQSYIDKWSNTWRAQLAVRASANSPIGRDMRGDRKGMTLGHEALMDAIDAGAIKHNGDPTLTRHTMNTRRAVNNYGVSFRKESRESPKKVDAYAAMFLAFLARREFLDKGKVARKRTGRVAFY